MTKVRYNNFTMGLSGKFGNIVFRQMKDGRTVVADEREERDPLFDVIQFWTQRQEFCF